MSLTITELPELGEHFAQAAQAVAGGEEPAVRFEAPRRPEFGDVSTNVAFELAKVAKRAPQELANAVIAQALANPDVRAAVADASAAGGFINLRLVPAFWQRAVAQIIARGARFGSGDAKGERISLEFGSANPTGPANVVQGRSLSVGDTLARALRFAGFGVFTEWIINDSGSQLEMLGRSVYARYRQFWEPDYAFPEKGYPGDYVVAIARDVRAADGERWLHAPESEWLPYLAWFARDVNVAGQKAVVERFRAHFDLWQSERALHEAGAIETGLERLRESGLVYQKDGATFVRTSATGDDQDRVAIRSTGQPAYFANDIAYHYDKLQRADHVIDILGPDHHGYIGRLRALASAYGRDNAIEVIISQQITLKRGDEIVSMSKRAGDVVTLDEVIDEVGVDAARFFFVMLSSDQPLTFDLALAKAQSSDNPVYYVQYGHARICSVLRRAALRAPQALERAQEGSSLTLLVEPVELSLMRTLAEFPAFIQTVARTRAVHRLAKYARDVAAAFHQFYDACTIVSDDEDRTAARLALAIATRTVLATTLDLCGVSSPESM